MLYHYRVALLGKTQSGDGAFDHSVTCKLFSSGSAGPNTVSLSRHTQEAAASMGTADGGFIFRFHLYTSIWARMQWSCYSLASHLFPAVQNASALATGIIHRCLFRLGTSLFPFLNVFGTPRGPLVTLSQISPHWRCDRDRLKLLGWACTWESVLTK